MLSPIVRGKRAFVVIWTDMTELEYNARVRKLIAFVVRRSSKASTKNDRTAYADIACLLLELLHD